MSCKQRLEDYLRERGVPYTTHHHARAITAQEVAAAEHVPGKMFAKTVMVVAGDVLAMLVLPAPMHVNSDKAARALGADSARLAGEDAFDRTFADCEVGAMAPFDNLYGVPVYVDEALARDEEIVFRAGTHTDTMTLSYADFERLVAPEVIGFADQPAA